MTTISVARENDVWGVTAGRGKDSTQKADGRALVLRAKRP